MRPLLRLSLALAFSILPSFVLAQDAPPPQAANTPSTPEKPPHLPPLGTITGTAICADTHRPARGATVMLVPIPPADSKDRQNAVSDSDSMSRVAMDGTYTLTHVLPGDYSVVVLLPGYLSPIETVIEAKMSNPGEKSGGPSLAMMREALLRNGSVSLHAAETETFDVTLQRGAAISGRVLYSDGSPATQATIDLENTAASGTRSAQALLGTALVRLLFTNQSVATDDQGNFRIAGIARGTYRVAAVTSQKSFMDIVADGNEGGAMSGALGILADPSALHIYAGDTLHKKSARTFELRNGDEVTGVDITIPVEAFHRVTGLVAAKDGRPVTSAGLTLTDVSDDSTAYTARLTTEGQFTFPAVPAGTYTLTAKTAQILALPPGVSAESVPFRFSNRKVLNAFADASQSVVVKDSDLSSVNFALTEVPLPPDANKDNDPNQVANPAPTQPGPND